MLNKSNTSEKISEIVDKTMNDMQNFSLHLPHIEFVEGLIKNKLTYFISEGDPSDYLFFPKQLWCLLWVFSYTLIPYIIVIIFSIVFKDYWLLLGILICSISASYSQIIIWGEMACLGYFLMGGFNFHNHVTFFFFCALWSGVFFRYSKAYQMKYFTTELMQKREFYYLMRNSNKILIIKK